MTFKAVTVHLKQMFCQFDRRDDWKPETKREMLEEVVNG